MMKICYDQRCNDIGVVIATKWRRYLFYLQPYFSALEAVLPKSLKGAVSSNSRLDEVFMGLLWLEYGKNWKFLMFGRKRRVFETQFHLIAVSIFQKRVRKIVEILVALTQC